ncbi:MAG: hypothetical protein FJX03_00205 [Alphaproteobacteria bacterium]|nr:hypothetical protein [Alphaproteobacteria bacterium]
MTGFVVVTYMSTEKFDAPIIVAGLFARKKQGYDPAFLLSHPNINEPLKEKLSTLLRSNFKRCVSFSLKWAVMENIALWLKKCLLMQLTTKKSELRLLMATG